MTRVVGGTLVFWLLARRVGPLRVERVRIELNRPFPFQHSGDAQGMRTHLELQIAGEPLRLVDYLAPRLLS